MAKRASNEQITQYIQDLETLIKHFGTLDKAAEILGASPDTIRAHYSRRTFPSSSITMKVREFVVALPTDRLTGEAHMLLRELLQTQFQLGVAEHEARMFDNVDVSMDPKFKKIVGQRDSLLERFKVAINRNTNNANITQRIDTLNTELFGEGSE